MAHPLGALSVEDFLRDHWQRRPCLVREAFPDFTSPLEGDDLAGLACEPLAEARLVAGPDADGGWALRHGPFSEADFDGLGEADWTLLVQDVEKHYPPLRELLDAFAFLPGWRMDDLMMSFAAPGGSVGPHVDQYDVFLLQAEGRRRWEIAERFDPARREDAPLDMLAEFEPEQTWVLEPGDMLYLPPNVAHHGVALDPCLTCSIGFRAPSAADLFLALGERLAERTDGGGRYSDPGLQAVDASGEIDGTALDRFRALLETHLDPGDEFAGFIGAFLSRFRQAHDPVPPPGNTPTASTLTTHLKMGGHVEPHPWARFNWVATETGADLYASGRRHACSRSLAIWVCDGLSGAPPLAEARDRLCLVELVAAGQLLVDGESEDHHRPASGQPPD